MNSQQIVIFARQLANCDTTQVPDADTSTQIGALTYLNIAYAQVVSRVNQDTGEDIFSEIATFDLVNGQTEYSYPTKSSILTGFDALLAVSINYNLNSVVDWKRLRPSRISNLNRDEFWHTTNQPFTDPFYIKYDS